jgi:hypothetical protein
MISLIEDHFEINDDGGASGQKGGCGHRCSRIQFCFEFTVPSVVGRIYPDVHARFVCSFLCLLGVFYVVCFLCLVLCSLDLLASFVCFFDLS